MYAIYHPFVTPLPPSRSPRLIKINYVRKVSCAYIPGAPRPPRRSRAHAPAQMRRGKARFLRDDVQAPRHLKIPGLSTTEPIRDSRAHIRAPEKLRKLLGLTSGHE